MRHIWHDTSVETITCPNRTTESKVSRHYNIDTHCFPDRHVILTTVRGCRSTRRRRRAVCAARGITGGTQNAISGAVGAVNACREDRVMQTDHSYVLSRFRMFYVTYHYALRAGLWQRHCRQMPRAYGVVGAYEKWLLIF